MLSGPEGNALGYSWTVMVLPFMELQSMYDAFDFKKPIYDNVNVAIREHAH